MEHGAATPAWVLLAYLVAGVCFILALRGLSSPASSRRGNRFGMVGMAIAVVTTLDPLSCRLDCAGRARDSPARTDLDMVRWPDLARDRHRRRRSASSPRGGSR